jgi:sulfur carrier protein
MITVTINGNRVELDQPMTIRELLETAHVPPNYLAVEINADVVPRENHAVQMVNDGDCVEVVTLVGGG